MTWLHALHLGVAYAERGEVDRPVKLFQQSIDLSNAQKLQNPIAVRSIGVLQKSPEKAWTYYQSAWTVAVKAAAAGVPIRDKTSNEPETEEQIINRIGLNLVSEISSFLQQQFDSDADAWNDAMTNFRSAVQGEGKMFIKNYTPDTFITLDIKLRLHNGEYDEARQTLSKECFPTYASARLDLMNMWNLAVEGIAKKEKGGKSDLTPKEAHQARIKDPIPDNIGCQYASMYCTNYW